MSRRRITLPFIAAQYVPRTIIACCILLARSVNRPAALLNRGGGLIYVMDYPDKVKP